MIRRVSIAVVVLVLSAAVVFAAESVVFKTSVVPPAAKTHKGSVKVVVTPAEGIHLNTEGTAMNFKITAPKQVKFDVTKLTDTKEIKGSRTYTFGYKTVGKMTAPANVKIDVTYVYCTGETGSCNFAKKQLSVVIPKGK